MGTTPISWSDLESIYCIVDKLGAEMMIYQYVCKKKCQIKYASVKNAYQSDGS